MQLTCPACGLTFETQATTNTRCRRCRKVVNVGAHSRPAASTFPGDDSDGPGVPDRVLIGGVLVAGGAYCFWHGFKMRRSSVTKAEPTGERSTWPLWCTFGALLVIVEVLVVVRSS